MTDTFRIDRPDGRVEYTDRPTGSGRVSDALSRNKTDSDKKSPRQVDHQAVASAIREIRKRIPKINDYFDYLSYLRRNNALAFDAVMKELKRQDPKTWIALQKYPQFRPLSKTIVGLKAGERSLMLGTGLATGKITGSMEKWLEGSLKDMMIRDRWGPYAKVLGDKASTLPAPPAPVYSNSRLGQYLKADAPRAAAAAEQAAAALEKSKVGMRAARGAAVVRVLGPVVDVGIGALDPEVASSAGKEILRRKARKLYEKGIFDEIEWSRSQELLSQGNYVEMNQLMADAAHRYIYGGTK